MSITATDTPVTGAIEAPQQEAVGEYQFIGFVGTTRHRISVACYRGTIVRGPFWRIFVWSNLSLNWDTLVSLLSDLRPPAGYELVRAHANRSEQFQYEFKMQG